MGKLESPKKGLKWCTWGAGALLFLICVAPARSRGQAANDTAGAPAATTKVPPVSLPQPGGESKSPQIPARDVPPLDQTNRRALEQRAGKDAAKLLLQSVPSGAEISIDGMFVGRTPLLLIVPPGTYKVEMRGQRAEYGERLVGLFPNETQQLVLTLALRYPAKITLR
jgi:hypothetical protein